MDVEALQRRFREAMRNSGLLKEAESLAPGALEVEDEQVTAEEETVGDVAEEASADEAPVTAVTKANLFQHPEAHPYVLNMALLQQYGPEWMEWENETLEIQVPRDFSSPSLSDLNLHKLNAMKTLHVVDTFWRKWEVFSLCTATLNGLFPDFEVMHVPTVGECAVAVDIAAYVREDVPWSDEVKAYLSAVHEHDGVFCTVPPLDFVEVDSEEYPVECSIVTKLWPAVRKTRKPPSVETPEAEQLRRLLDVEDELQEHRAKLKQQMGLLRDV